MGTEQPDWCQCVLDAALGDESRAVLTGAIGYHHLFSVISLPLFLPLFSSQLAYSPILLAPAPVVEPTAPPTELPYVYLPPPS